MSISGALNAALSGLGASARSAAVVSDNVANASTPGYGPRRIELAARATGQVGAGVQVSGITRDHDPRLTGDRRLAEAASAEARAAATGWSRIEALIGLPGSGDMHSALQDTGQGSRVLDWLLQAFGTPPGDIQFVGGYQMEAIAERYRFYSFGDSMLIL